MYSPNLLQEGVERGALPRRGAGRVEDVERHVQEVGDKVHVALRSAASGLAGETSVLSKSQEEELDVMDG